MFIETSVSIANSVDPDQKPRSVASGLGLYYVLMYIFGYARLKWIKSKIIYKCLSPYRGTEMGSKGNIIS